MTLKVPSLPNGWHSTSTLAPSARAFTVAARTSSTPTCASQLGGSVFAAVTAPNVVPPELTKA